MLGCVHHDDYDDKYSSCIYNNNKHETYEDRISTRPVR